MTAVMLSTSHGATDSSWKDVLDRERGEGAIRVEDGVHVPGDSARIRAQNLQVDAVISEELNARVATRIEDRLAVVAFKASGCFQHAGQRSPPLLEEAFSRVHEGAETSLEGLSQGAQHDADLPETTPASADRRAVNTLSQILAYMTLAEVNHGIIVTGDVWWMVERVSKTSLKVSPPIGWDCKGNQPTIFAAILFITDKARRDKGGSRSPGKEVRLQSDNTGGMTGLTGSANETAEQRVKPWNFFAPEPEGQEVPEAHLNLSPGAPIAHGWSGWISLGEVDGCPAAIKLAPLDSQRGQVLQAEAQNYLKLRHLWGKCVPRLLAHGTTCNGEVVFLAVEFIRGAELGHGNLTPSIAHGAKKALAAVHAAGLLHNDLDPQNILVAEQEGTSEECAVFIIDFGFSVPNKSRKDCKKEMRLLNEFLA